jgi:hypothetical protein
MAGRNLTALAHPWPSPPLLAVLFDVHAGILPADTTTQGGYTHQPSPEAIAETLGFWLAATAISVTLASRDAHARATPTLRRARQSAGMA